MPNTPLTTRWGATPWTIDFQPVRHPLPDKVDFAVIGGGFAGLAAAAWLRRIAPKMSVALFESASIGAGSSGHTGGMVLAETAAGDLPGLGDVLAGYSETTKELGVDGDLMLPGVWEIARRDGLAESPISWNDSGTLRAVKHVPGGSVDPGKIVTGLARAAETAGARIYENAPVSAVDFGESSRLHVRGTSIRANKVLIATNAMSLEISDLVNRAEPKFTLAIATEPLTAAQLEDCGLATRKPFYTVDFPYLWGRLLSTGAVIFGAGLVHLNGWRGLATLDISSGEAAQLITRLETRVRGLRPSLHDVQFTHRWGGPILIPDQWRPVFTEHPRGANAIVLGGFSGHGVALSVYLGRWAADAMCGRKALPNWST